MLTREVHSTPPAFHAQRIRARVQG